MLLRDEAFVVGYSGDRSCAWVRWRFDLDLGHVQDSRDPIIVSVDDVDSL